MSAVGVDACRAGWVAVVLADGQRPVGAVASTLEALAAEIPAAEGFAVDIPIGLPRDGHRRADTEAQAFLGPRRSSVFLTPIREALVASTHAEASRLSRARTGHGVSQQAYALRRKILEADRWRRQTAAPVWEVHPEVSFALLLGHPARSPKRTWAGMRERHRALQGAGIELGDLGLAGQRAAVDDVLDAAAAAWSARRLLRGEAMTIPDPPERDPDTGEPVAIWA